MIGGSIVNGVIYWNGVEQSQVGFQRKLGTGGDVGSASALGIVDASSASTDIDFYAKCDDALDVFDLVEGSLTVIRIAAT